LQPLCELNSWISTHQGLIVYSVRVAKLASRHNTKPITEHFLLLKKKTRRRYTPKDILPVIAQFRNTRLVIPLDRDLSP
jgi:hypothetical protein